MGASKTKINKSVLHFLVDRTHRPASEIKSMYAIFLQHFPSGRIESPDNLCLCLQKFSLLSTEYLDSKAAERLYRVFDASNRNPKQDGGIDFLHFMIVSHVLEYGTPLQRMTLYFQSFDVDNDQVITRNDLETCLPPTVESRQLAQQLLRRWDMNGDGVVSLDDFQKYIMNDTDLMLHFTDSNDRVRRDSVTVDSSTDNNRSANVYNINRGTFAKSQ